MSNVTTMAWQAPTIIDLETLVGAEMNVSMNAGDLMVAGS
jgi:hypothetical protein